MKTKFKTLTVCLDMYGCPNRCRHCWLGHAPNGHMTVGDLTEIAARFKPYADAFEIFDWYREPDFGDDYRALWALRERLSDRVTPHFELISVWRIVRDGEYVKWLASLGLKKAQLTLFGGEATTDRYTGRKGAYRDILQAIDILIAHGIVPRIQVFVNKDNVDELSLVEKLIVERRLPERCAAFGGEWTGFVHSGSCDGENAKLYGVRVTLEDLEKIPPLLSAYTLKHFHARTLDEVFGRTERALYQKLAQDCSTASCASDRPVLYVDSAYDVYPNISAAAPYWRLGNLKTHSAEEILQNYALDRSAAQTVRRRIPLGEIVKRCGNPDSLRLFGERDYIIYLLNQFCERECFLTS